ncbi:MAG TPA: ABC transporter substrate-binding protein [Candidatus Paceibacterota bacterium]|nr:ABC transporter substrate-binding protein [Candidatus Pacearchaeota archaeon]HRZ50994.1 ABC transporter substrate-binding protein [Candidatus Paceibacterota bacterium]HSA36715.1 ABC transporter substrate-binding protein [Candidatus Paceibacterota bacterium]
MNRKIPFVLVLAAAAAGLFYLSTSKTPEPTPEISSQNKQITDLSGETKTFKTPCEKVILPRSRDIYELSAVLGGQTADKIVAWGEDIKTSDTDAYKKYSEKFPSLADKPLVGSIYNDSLDPENVLSYNPDLIVMDNFMTRRQYKSVDRLKEAGMPMAFMDQTNDILTNQQKGITVLGQLFNKEERAEEIADFVDGQINIVTSRLAKIEKTAPVVYMETGDLGAKQYGSTWGVDVNGQYTSWGAMIQYAGGKNIVGDLPGELFSIDPEYLLKSNPDVIIITGANWPTVEDSMRMGYYTSGDEAQQLLKSFTNRPGWQDLEAVKNGRVYAIHHGMTMHIFAFAALQQMAKWFYPEEFADINPEANLKEFHNRFMPIEYSGTWFTEISK